MNEWVKDDRVLENWGSLNIAYFFKQDKAAVFIVSLLVGVWLSLETSGFTLCFWQRLWITVGQPWTHGEEDCNHQDSKSWEWTIYPVVAPGLPTDIATQETWDRTWRILWSLRGWQMFLNFCPSRYTIGLDFPVPLEVQICLGDVLWPVKCEWSSSLGD